MCAYSEPLRAIFLLPLAGQVDNEDAEVLPVCSTLTNENRHSERELLHVQARNVFKYVSVQLHSCAEWALLGLIRSGCSQSNLITTNFLHFFLLKGCLQTSQRIPFTNQ